VTHMIASNVPSSRDLRRSESVRPAKLNTHSTVELATGRQDQFISGNGQTVGTFPVFTLNNQYRVYISYRSVTGVSLNKPGGQDELSLHAVPMVRTSTVQVLSFQVFVCVTVHNTNCIYICRYSIV
jgi:hypothetical protein